MPKIHNDVIEMARELSMTHTRIQIADALGITKNAVVGMCSRHGIVPVVAVIIPNHESRKRAKRANTPKNLRPSVVKRKKDLQSITENIAPEAARLRDSGMSTGQIAQSLGVGRSTIYRAIGPIAPSPHKYDPETVRMVRSLVANGSTRIQAAIEVGVSYNVADHMARGARESRDSMDDSAFIRKHIYRRPRRIIASPEDLMCAARLFASGTIDRAEMSRRLAQPQQRAA